MNTQTLESQLQIGSRKAASAAQAMTLIGYGDCNDNYNIPFRSLDFRIKCEDYNDFEKCIEIIDSYNEFYAAEMIPFLRKYLSLKKYYNENNPNNGNSFFEFEIGREGSPAFYISFRPNWDKLIITETGNVPYTINDFKKYMETLRLCINADEMDIEISHKVTARFWFD